ncbi:DUF1761 domain-containing protein [Devosia sp.]|uniref:DUF1761 domain-containing protein n=1 Tax=Devosia sp. TaxID=1871048 RepID=UPI003263456D
MSFSVNWLAVVVATVAAFAFGAVWYTTLSKQWLAALGKTREQLNVGFTPFIWSVVVELIMAYVLAVLLGNLPGGITIATGITVGVIAWVGFVATTLIMNHRYEGMSWALTIIDSGHLLGVLAIQGLVIGLFGGVVAPVVA